ncbi:phosphatidate cytidylyltransferase [Mycoplasmopsis synoviae]
MLKGHGGILDRIDGIASVFPLWSFLMVILYFLNYVG